MSQVSVQHIFKSFDEQVVLENVSLDIEEGEIFGLIGPNGAGKSTLIDIMIGLQKADSGQIFHKNLQVPQDITEIRSSLGLVPQEIALMPDLSARSNLKYFGGLYGLSGQDLDHRVEEALEAVSLVDTGKKKVKEFSGGMQRRLNIAAALLHRPKFLILDEPTVGVDPQSRNKIFESIKEMNQKYQMTVLYTSHYMEEIEALCERIFILDQGRQVAYGTQDEIKLLVQDSVKWLIEFLTVQPGFEEQIIQLDGVDQVTMENNKYHLIVDPLMFKTNQLLGLIQETNLEIKHLTREELTLEEAFLQLTGKTLRD